MYFDDPDNQPPEGTENTGETGEMPSPEEPKDQGAGESQKPSFEEGDVPQDLSAVFDVPVTVRAVLGQAQLQVNQLLKIGRGAVIELDRKVGEAIDIFVNDRLVARGEVVVIEDHLGISMTEIIKSDQ